MNYQETIEYLYASAPLFQQVGGAAYKPGLQVTETLDEHFAHPHRRYKCIHVAGTNGKGSCAHTLAAWLQLAGFKVGLYTSPHLVDFRERIRVNGAMIPQQRVVDFVKAERSFFEPLHPSFFELTTALAFLYFAEEQVDYAVIEVGLGGRLDCTNIIRPIASVITNISRDHTQFLGNNLAEIAAEKAGIIKPGVPVVVGETTPETRPVFQEKARAVHAPLTFAEDQPEIKAWQYAPTECTMTYQTRHFGEIRGVLSGNCQVLNTNTLLHVMQVLLPTFPAKYRDLLRESIPQAFYQVTALTQLRGRWEKTEQHPDLICDTGHNPGGWEYLAHQLSHAEYRHKHIVFGMAADKDVSRVLALLPHDATYYFTRASVKRAMNEQELQAIAANEGLQGEAYPTVHAAICAARKAAHSQDLIFVGGSSFVVADYLSDHHQPAAGA